MSESPLPFFFFIGLFTIGYWYDGVASVITAFATILFALAVIALKIALVISITYLAAVVAPIAYAWWKSTGRAKWIDWSWRIHALFGTRKHRLREDLNQERHEHSRARRELVRTRGALASASSEARQANALAQESQREIARQLSEIRRLESLKSVRSRIRTRSPKPRKPSRLTLSDVPFSDVPIDQGMSEG